MAAKKEENVFEIARQQFERAAEAIKLENWLRVVLSQPKNELIVPSKPSKDIGSSTITSSVLSRVVFATTMMCISMR